MVNKMSEEMEVLKRELEHVKSEPEPEVDEESTINASQTTAAFPKSVVPSEKASEAASQEVLVESQQEVAEPEQE